MSALGVKRTFPRLTTMKSGRVRARILQTWSPAGAPIEILENKNVSVSRPPKPQTPDRSEKPSALSARTGGELLREFFGTLCADFGRLSPFRSHIREAGARCESEEAAYLSGFVGAPEEIRTPDPQIRSLENPVDMGRLAATKPLQMV